MTTESQRTILKNLSFDKQLRIWITEKSDIENVYKLKVLTEEEKIEIMEMLTKMGFEKTERDYDLSVFRDSYFYEGKDESLFTEKSTLLNIVDNIIVSEITKNNIDKDMFPILSKYNYEKKIKICSFSNDTVTVSIYNDNLKIDLNNSTFEETVNILKKLKSTKVSF